MSIHGSEKLPLFSTKDTDKSWPAWRVLILAGTTAIYVAGIMPISMCSPLIPALEEDIGLGWTKIHSGLVLSIPVVFEAAGLLCLGWLADVYGGTGMLVFALSICSIFIGLISFQQVPGSILVFMGLTAFIRGIVWPAATKVFGDMLGARQWEIGICLLAIASRSGSLLTSEITGTILPAVGWRRAVGVFSGIVLATCVLFQFVVVTVERMRAGDASPPCFDCGRGDASGPRWGKVREFFSEPDAWLLLGFATALQPLWVWGNYVGAFAHSIYGVSVGSSALIDGAYPCGQVLNIVVTLLVGLCGGNHSRRVIYVMSSFGLLLAAIIPVIFVYFDVPLTAFVVLVGLMGFSNGAIDYVASAVYCMHVGRRTGDSSLYLGFMYFIAYVVGATTAYIYGCIRQVSESHAFKVEMIVASVSAVMSFACLTLHIWRNWDGALFRTV